MTEAPGASHTSAYTVQLTSEPTGDVTVALTLASGGAGAATLAPPALTFSASGAGSWNTPQTVTVTGGDDSIAADRSTAIIHAASGADYDGAMADVTVTLINGAANDVRGIITSKVSITVSEAPGPMHQADYTVRLASEPTDTVIVTLALPAAAQDAAIVLPATLTFTAANWNNARDITVTGGGDDIASDRMVGWRQALTPHPGVRIRRWNRIGADSDPVRGVGHDLRGRAHDAPDDRRQCGGARGARAGGVELLVGAHPRKQGAGAVISGRELREMIVEVFDHLALGLGDEPKAPPIAGKPGRHADGERSGIPERVEPARR